jgi:hypothetical protein
MTLGLVFVVLVVAGFIAMFISTWPTSFPAARIAWGCWLVASLLWALTSGR